MRRTRVADVKVSPPCGKTRRFSCNSSRRGRLGMPGDASHIEHPAGARPLRILRGRLARDLARTPVPEGHFAHRTLMPCRRPPAEPEILETLEAMILPHGTWFTPDRPPYDWSFVWQPATLALIAAAAVVAVAWRLVASRMPRPEIGLLRPLGRLAPWVPRLLAIPAGGSLLAPAARGGDLAPA